MASLAAIAVIAAAGSAAAGYVAHVPRIAYHGIAAAGQSRTLAQRPPAAGIRATAVLAVNGAQAAAQIPVVACPTRYGLLPHPPPRYPSMLAVPLPAGLAGRLAYYSDSARFVQPTLATRGWSCSAEVGADGSTSIAVFPSGSSASGPEQVQAHDDSACVGCIYTTACPLVAGAATDLHFNFGIQCPARPPQEIVTWLAGTPAVSNSGSDVIAFTDPPGVSGDGAGSGGPSYARGVLLFSWGIARNPRASVITCTLPVPDRDLCTAVLATFRQQNWPDGVPPAGGGSTPPPVLPAGIDEVVLVHGIRTGCDEPGMSSDHFVNGPTSYSALADGVVDSGRGFYSFCYDHDLAFSRNSGLSWSNRDRCFSPTTSHGPSASLNLSVPFDSNTAPLAASQGPGAAARDSNYDSDGPLAYDASKLDDCLTALVKQDQAASGGAPHGIAVVGNSMGGAIVRGWLELAAQRHSTSLNEVTTVIFLEAATEGSWLEAVVESAQAGLSLASLDNPAYRLIQQLADRVAASFQVDPTRPGVMDLAPASFTVPGTAVGAYDRSIIAGPPPPRLHYYTFSVDITLHSGLILRSST